MRKYVSIFAGVLMLVLCFVPSRAELTKEEKQRVVGYVNNINKQIKELNEECEDNYDVIVKELEELEKRIQKLEDTE